MGTISLTEELAAALFPKTRAAVLGLLYSHPGESYYLRQIVDLTGLAVGQVQRELRLLSESGVLSRTEQGRHVYFRANEECPIYGELRGIVAKTMGAATVIGSALEHLAPRIRVAFIYGSVARGEETSISDLDIMVVGDSAFPDVASAVGGAEELLRREINLTVYPTEEFRSKVQAGHHFIKQVLSHEMLFIIGGESELAALLHQQVDS